MEHLAVIPARSGSKGLKDKNIKLLAGKPMIAYTIEAAIESGIFGCIHVSTDSETYAEIAKCYGADVPFLRSEALSSDQAKSWDVVKEVLERYQEIGIVFDTITLLQPTSPLRNAQDIKNAYGLFQKKKAKAVVSVCEMEYSPLLSNTVPDNLSMEGFLVKKDLWQRQNLETFYRINGAIYIVDRDYMYESDNLYRRGSFAYIMDRWRSVDIDDKFDFEFAEFIMARVLNEEK